MIIRTSAIAGFGVVLNELTVQAGMVFAQLVYSVFFALDKPEFEFDNEQRQKELNWIFTALMLWHVFVATLQCIEHMSGYKQKMPFITVLMIIQLSFASYILQYWVCDVQGDSFSDTKARKRWQCYMYLEIAIVVASVTNSVLYLFVRALKFDP